LEPDQLVFAQTLMPEQGVVFLMYHELETPGRALRQAEPGYVRYIVRAHNFRAQMELLKSKGWKGVSVGEAINSFAPKTVAITFDDGCETDLLSAAPVLQDLGFGATFYITAGWSGKPGCLSHSQLRELSARGFELGCHSMSHSYLSDLDDGELRHEIQDPKLQLEQLIGKPVEHFSCPGGRYDQRVSQFARDAGYRTVATSEIHVNTPATNRYALGRIAIMRNTSLTELLELCQGQGLWQWKLTVQFRSAVRSVLGNAAYDRLRERLLRRGASG
jgi:peptidoglycan/xylan/chitin deacetylase (PgdA/CDA1 family)